MSEPLSATDEMTTAEAIGRFAQELRAFDDLNEAMIHDLVVDAGRRLLDGSACLAVKRNV